MRYRSHGSHCKRLHDVMMYLTKVRVVDRRIIDCSPLEAAVDLIPNEDTNLIIRHGV